MRTITTPSSLPTLSTALAALTVAALTGCHEHGHSHGENELITRVVVELTPSAGGAAVTATFDDPDGDGGAAPTVEPIALAAGTTYAGTIRFYNALEATPEDITAEVRDEAAEHQVFLTGTAVNGPAANNPGAPLTHTYADMDANGHPIGLANTLVASAGSGTLTITLRHLPPVGGNDAKSGDLAAQVRADGMDAIAGSTDAKVDFAVTVGATTAN